MPAEPPEFVRCSSRTVTAEEDDSVRDMVKDSQAMKQAVEQILVTGTTVDTESLPDAALDQRPRRCMLQLERYATPENAARSLALLQLAREEWPGELCFGGPEDPAADVLGLYASGHSDVEAVRRVAASEYETNTYQVSWPGGYRCRVEFGWCTAAQINSMCAACNMYALAVALVVVATLFVFS